MNKASEIFLSWTRAMNPTPEQTILADKRYTICQTCPSRETSILFTEICGKCGCPLGKKIFTPRMGACPLDKWNKIEN